MKILKTNTIQDLNDGELKSESLSTYYKKIKETAGIYANPQAALDSEEMAYYVTSELHNSPDDNKEALNWGVTCMYPVTVDGECCMTRGHFHTNPDYPEYYLCTSGEGHLLCWNGKDDVIAYHMTPGSLQYIDGRYAHRLINTGEEIFKVSACWADASGHDYETIEKKGFPVRVFKHDGKLEWVKTDQ